MQIKIRTVNKDNKASYAFMEKAMEKLKKLDSEFMELIKENPEILNDKPATLDLNNAVASIISSIYINKLNMFIKTMTKENAFHFIDVVAEDMRYLIKKRYK